MNKKVSFFLRCAVSLGLLYALTKFVPYDELLKTFADSHKIYIFYAFLAFIFAHIVIVLRWRFLLFSLGIKVSFLEAGIAFLCGLFFNLFFPSFVAGDAFRAFSIFSQYKQGSKVASSVLMDRFSGAVGLVMLVAVFYFFGRHLIPTIQVLTPLGLFFLFVGLWALFIFSKSFFLFFAKVLKKHPALHEKAITLHDQLYFFKEKPSVFFRSLFYSVSVHIFVSLGFFLASRGFGVQISFIYFLILVPIIMAIAMIPITIVGAGSREAAAVYFFSLIGIAPKISFGMSLLNLAFFVFAGILGGIIYVSVYHRWLQRNS
ncbi:MAG: flippase-like domain-containing protein [Candidatus Omnitrophota bacterium]|nr:MAG: flippase-like domain-containing protein [Candidatus Omnitrophota bacterium]